MKNFRLHVIGGFAFAWHYEASSDVHLTGDVNFERKCRCWIRNGLVCGTRERAGLFCLSQIYSVLMLQAKSSRFTELFFRYWNRLNWGWIHKIQTFYEIAITHSILLYTLNSSIPSWRCFFFFFLRNISNKNRAIKYSCKSESSFYLHNLLYFHFTLQQFVQDFVRYTCTKILDSKRTNLGYIIYFALDRNFPPSILSPVLFSARHCLYVLIFIFFFFKNYSLHLFCFSLPFHGTLSFSKKRKDFQFRLGLLTISSSKFLQTVYLAHNFLRSH